MFSYVDIRKALFDSLSSSQTKWTDFSENDIGTVIVSAVASVVDKLAYYLDKTKDEFYVSTALQRENMVRLVSLVGYRPFFPRSARCWLMVTAPEGVNGQIVIEPLTAFSSEYTSFYTVERVVLNFTEEQRVQYFQVFQGALTVVPIEMVDIVGGHYVFTVGGVSEDYIGVVWEGVEFKRLDDSEILPYTGFYFQLTYAPDGKPAVRFPLNYDGHLGAGTGQISSNAVLSVQFLVTSEGQGNIAAGALSGVFEDMSSGSVAVSCSELLAAVYENPEAAYGGRIWETVEEIRANLNYFIKSAGRAVTLRDHEFLISKVPGVLSVSCYDKSMDSDVPHYYEVHAVVQRENGVSLSGIQKDIESIMRPLMMVGTSLVLEEPIPLRLVASLSVDARVQTEIEKNLLSASLLAELKAFVAELNVSEKFSKALFARRVFDKFSGVLDMDVVMTYMDESDRSVEFGYKNVVTVADSDISILVRAVV